MSRLSRGRVTRLCGVNDTGVAENTLVDTLLIGKLVKESGGGGCYGFCGCWG